MELIAVSRAERGLPRLGEHHVVILDGIVEEISDAFLCACRNYRTALEIETYTYETLPETLRPSSIEQGLVAEETWLNRRLQSLPTE